MSTANRGRTTEKRSRAAGTGLQLYTPASDE